MLLLLCSPTTSIPTSRSPAGQQRSPACAPRTLLIEQVHAERATSGVVTVRGEASGATLQIEVQLSPEPTPRVQWYEISG